MHCRTPKRDAQHRQMLVSYPRERSQQSAYGIGAIVRADLPSTHRIGPTEQQRLSLFLGET
jgi:hypothetical protein